MALKGSGLCKRFLYMEMSRDRSVKKKSFDRVLFHQGGLLTGWSFIREPFPQGGLSSGWSLIRVVSCQGGLSSVWSLIRVVSCQGGISSGWPMVRVVSCHGAISSGWFLIRVVGEQIQWRLSHCSVKHVSVWGLTYRSAVQRGGEWKRFPL